MHLLRSGVLALVLGTMSTGCAGAAHDIAKAATPGVIEGMAEGVSDPATQRKLVDSIDQKLVADATHRMASGIVDGTISTFEDPERMERIQRFAAAAIGPVVQTMDGAVAGVIDTTFAHAFSDDNMLKIRLLTRAMVADIVGQVMESVKSELGTKEERDAAIGSTVRLVMKEATLGFQDAVDETAKRKADGEMNKHEGNVLSAVNKAAESGGSIVYIAAGVVAALVIGLAITLIVMTRRRRLHRTEVAERDASLLLLAQAIKSTEDKPWSGELNDALKSTFRDAEGTDYLRKLLRKDEERHVGHPSAARGAAGDASGDRSTLDGSAPRH